MRFHCNTTPEETIDYLRDSAIRSNAGPQVIDCIDDLRALLDTPIELEKRDEELNEAESDRDDLYGELSDLVEGMETACEILESIHEKPAEASDFFDAADLKNISRQLDFAKKALERHKEG